MGQLTSVSAAIRTRVGRFSGTAGQPWIIVHQSGADLLNDPMIPSSTVGSVRRGESLYHYQPLPHGGRPGGDDERLGSEHLYVRLATTSSDRWEPEVVIVWATSRSKGIVPLAIETDLTAALSTNPRKGAVSVPIRPALLGTDETIIERLLLVIVTYDAPYAGTDDPISLQVATPDTKPVDHVITDTPQTDLEIDTANIYEIPVDAPFRRGQLRGVDGAQIRLTIHGSDKWVPKKLFLFGLNKAIERPDAIIPLVKIRDPGPLSAHPAEGVPYKLLPVL